MVPPTGRIFWVVGSDLTLTQGYPPARNQPQDHSWVSVCYTLCSVLNQRGGLVLPPTGASRT